MTKNKLVSKRNEPKPIHPNKGALKQLISDIINAEKTKKKLKPLYDNLIRLSLDDKNNFILLFEVLKENIQLQQNPSLNIHITHNLQDAVNKQPDQKTKEFCCQLYTNHLSDAMRAAEAPPQNTNKTSELSQLSFFKRTKSSTYLGVGATLFTLSALMIGASLLKTGIIAAAVLPPNPLTTPMAITAIVLGTVFAAVGAVTMAFGLVKQSKEEPSKKWRDSSHEEVNAPISDSPTTVVITSATPAMA